MPGLLRLHRLDGLPIIQCRIGFPKDQWAGTDDRPVITVSALVDTGATHVVMPSRLISSLNLPHLGTVPNAIVGGHKPMRSMHLCDVIIDGEIYIPPYSGFAFTIPNVAVIDDILEAADIILGWSALSHVDLSFSRDGTMVVHLPQGK